MKNNTKKVLACLVAGTVAIGMKYTLEQIENEKKKKKSRIKRLRQSQSKAEGENRYIKIKDDTDDMDIEKKEIESCVEQSIAEIQSDKEEKNEDLDVKDFNIETSYTETLDKVVSDEEISNKEIEVQISGQNLTKEQQGKETIFTVEEKEEMESQEDVEIISPEDIPMVQVAATEEMEEELIPATEKEEEENEIGVMDKEKSEEETVDLEEAKEILKRKINWQEADGVKTEIDYSRLPAAAVLNVSELSLAEIKSLFTIQEISDEIFKRIYGKSYKTDCIVPRSELRYLRMLYYGFDDKTHVGEMIVNVSIAEDIRDIFYLLYQEKYQIERMVLVDEYGADDVLSMAANNTSGFNYRRIDGMSVMSKHSRGMAVDINPKQNPYVRTINGEINCQPQSGEIYMDREKDFPHKINHEDLCYCLFRTYGFTWGGDWEDMKDYQHFQKQY